MEKKELAVGDSTRVKLIFNTGHYSSQVRKSARIMCNAAGIVPRLNIAADVKRDMDSVDVYRALPTLVDLDTERPENQKDPWNYQVTLKNVSDEDLEFSVVSMPHHYVHIDFPSGLKLGPGDEKTFKVEFEPGIADELFTESFTIEASDAKHTRTTIPLVKSRRWGPAPLSSL